MPRVIYPMVPYRFLGVFVNTALGIRSPSILRFG